MMTTCIPFFRVARVTPAASGAVCAFAPEGDKIETTKSTGRQRVHFIDKLLQTIVLFSVRRVREAASTESQGHRRLRSKASGSAARMVKALGVGDCETALQGEMRARKRSLAN
jgi:hypothetical protein